jgi:hypothetical protein
MCVLNSYSHHHPESGNYLDGQSDRNNWSHREEFLIRTGNSNKGQRSQFYDGTYSCNYVIFSVLSIEESYCPISQAL